MKTAMLSCILFVCVNGLLALSGYGTSAPVVNDTVDPSLSILAPNGGEAWYIGDTNDITWTAVSVDVPGGSNYLRLRLSSKLDETPTEMRMFWIIDRDNSKKSNKD